MHADNRRLTARVVLIMVAVVTTTMVLFSGGPNGPLSFAQQQTTTPPTVKFLNPDDDTSNEISAKPDMSGAPTGGSYHLVTTVASLPANPAVTFQYQSGTATPFVIGTATQIGDTFYFHWPTAMMPADGNYTLIAILFSNGNEVSRDTQAVVVNNADEPPPGGLNPTTERSETVEIVDPVIGDPLGFYDPAGSVRYTTSLLVRHSADTTELTTYYTVSPPGTEPEWEECGNESADDADDWVRCVLVAPHVPPQVTGVAVVASDQALQAPAPADPDSGDAHRVFGYDADPTSITLAGASGEQTVNRCTGPITATVFDQNGNRVVGANADVHAQGPNETLAFDDNDASSNSTSASQPPEDHPTQGARNCESTTNPPPGAGSQGWHEDGAMDRKHIESTTGTDDEGTFSFKLFSNAQGTTQYTVWADEDGNDKLCSQEAQANGSLGWGVAAPAATGVADDEATCVVPSPTDRTTSPPASNTTSPPASNTTSPPPTNTTSPAPSPSTTSPSPTPSTTSPSPSPSQSSPSTSPSPTASPTTEPPPDRPTTVTSSVNGRSTDKGFAGGVDAAKKRCEKNRLVKIKKPGKGVIGKDRTNKAGKWNLRRPNAEGRFFALVMAKKYTNQQGETFRCTRDRSRSFRRNG